MSSTAFLQAQMGARLSSQQRAGGTASSGGSAAYPPSPAVAPPQRARPCLRAVPVQLSSPVPRQQWAQRLRCLAAADGADGAGTTQQPPSAALVLSSSDEEPGGPYSITRKSEASSSAQQTSSAGSSGLSTASSSSADEGDGGSGGEHGSAVRIDLQLPRRSLLVQFTCNVCGGRSGRLVNPVAWDRGMVIAKCQHCPSWHKLADAANLVEEIRYADLEDE